MDEAREWLEMPNKSIAGGILIVNNLIERLEQAEAARDALKQAYHEADDLLWLGENHRLPDLDGMLARIERRGLSDAK